MFLKTPYINIASFIHRIADSQYHFPFRSVAGIIRVYAFCYGGLVAKTCPTLTTPWTVTGQAPLSMEFSRQEYWGGLPFPSPRDLPDPEIEPGCPALQIYSLPTEPPGKPYVFCCAYAQRCASLALLEIVILSSKLLAILPWKEQHMRVPAVHTASTCDS